MRWAKIQVFGQIERRGWGPACRESNKMRICLILLMLTGLVWAKPSYRQLSNEGNKALKEKNYTLAIARFERLVREYPKDADAHNMLGFALFQQGRTTRALYEFRQALARRRYHSEAQHNFLLAVGKRSTELAREKKYAEALQLTDEIISSYSWHPQLAALYYYRGKVLFYRGDEKAALKSWKEASRRSPQSATTLFLEGYEAWQQGKNQKAGELLQQAMKKLPDDPIFRNYYGRLLEDLGKNKLALAQYKKILDGDHPPYLDLLVNASRIHRRQGDLEAATDALQQARQIRPDFASIHAYLAAVHAVRGEQAKFEEEIGLARARDSRPLLLFLDEPGKLAFVDGKEIGPAPTAAFVKPGKHRLEAGLARGEVIVAADQVAKVLVAEKTLSLESLGVASSSKSPAPPFVLKDRTNKRWRLSDHLYKKPVLLLFWTIGDQNSATYLDRMIGFRDRQGDNLAAAAIHVHPKEARKALKLYLSKPRTIGHLWGDGSVMKEYGGTEAPFAVLIDQEGFIADSGPAFEVFNRFQLSEK